MSSKSGYAPIWRCALGACRRVARALYFVRDPHPGAVTVVVDRHRPLPPLTEEIRDAARRRPGGWVYAVDPEFAGDSSAPRRGIIGAWRVDGLGRLTGEFRHNPDYVPSAGALRLPPPTDPLDEVLQQAAYRQVDDDVVVAAVLAAELLLPLGRAPGLLSVPDDRGGGWVIVAYSSRAQADLAADDPSFAAPGAEAVGWQRRTGRDLATAWPAGHDLEINPGSAASIRITGKQLRAALEADQAPA